MNAWQGIRKTFKRKGIPHPVLTDLVYYYGVENGLLKNINHHDFRRELSDYLPGFLSLRSSLKWGVWIDLILDFIEDLQTWCIHQPRVNIQHRISYIAYTDNVDILLAISKLLDIPILFLLQDNTEMAFFTVKHPIL